MNVIKIMLVLFATIKILFGFSNAFCSNIGSKLDSPPPELRIESAYISEDDKRKVLPLEGEPKILLVKLGNNKIVPDANVRVRFDSVLKTLPKGNEMYLLGFKADSGEYAFFSSMRISNIFPPNAYDDLKSKLTVLFPQSTYKVVDYAKNLTSISKL